jgi:hypothetical protein
VDKSEKLLDSLSREKNVSRVLSDLVAVLRDTTTHSQLPSRIPGTALLNPRSSPTNTWQLLLLSSNCPTTPQQLPWIQSLPLKLHLVSSGPQGDM